MCVVIWHYSFEHKHQHGDKIYPNAYALHLCAMYILTPAWNDTACVHVVSRNWTLSGKNIHELVLVNFAASVRTSLLSLAPKPPVHRTPVAARGLSSRLRFRFRLRLHRAPACLQTWPYTPAVQPSPNLCCLPTRTDTAPRDWWTQKAKDLARRWCNAYMSNCALYPPVI